MALLKSITAALALLLTLSASPATARSSDQNSMLTALFPLGAQPSGSQPPKTLTTSRTGTGTGKSCHLTTWSETIITQTRVVGQPAAESVTTTSSLITLAPSVGCVCGRHDKVVGAGTTTGADGKTGYVCEAAATGISVAA